MRNPKAIVRTAETEAVQAENNEKRQQAEARKPETPLIGIDAIAAFLGRGRTTIIDWRQTFRDFPVSSDKYAIWVSTKELLAEWKEAHIYLFRTRQELQRELRERKTRRW